MKSLIADQTDSEKTSILSALKYLMQEAERGGYDDLHTILQTAMELAQTKSDLLSNHIFDAANDDDTQRTLDFFLRFARADRYVQRNVIELIERLEKNNTGVRGV